MKRVCKLHHRSFEDGVCPKCDQDGKAEKGDIESIINILESSANGIGKDIKDLQHHLGIIENQIYRLKKISRK